MLGFSTLAVSLGLAAYGLVVAVLGARWRRRDLVRSAEAATYAIFGLLTVANLAMIYALVTRDFSISYVAQVGSHATPQLYTVISLWGALEGSILFWGWVLAAYSALAVYLYRDEPGTLVPYAMATLLGVGIFFYILLIGPANPFRAVWPVPADGPGPNPLLQNHPLMALHPPLMYLGYVGLTVPFAFAIGALLSGRLDERWIHMTRRWTVAAWGFLSLAIVAGMWWSYEVLGWGGYWAWDPVENASLMPWLTATAFLHSVMVQERRDMLRVWNLTLIIATFLLTILGTFLTRSGVIASVHAFADGPIGLYFLVFMAIVLLFSVGLLAGRSAELGSTGQVDALASRESVILLNNLLLVTFTFTVLLGTLFPLLAEAARGVKVSVGAPFFNRMTVPVCVGLIFLMGVGPALPWRGMARDALFGRFIVPLSTALLVALAALVLGLREPYTLLAFAFGAFALVVNLREFGQGARRRMQAHGERRHEALARLVAANPRRYGGYTAHVGIIVMAVAIAASSNFRQEAEMTMRPGELVEMGGYGLRFQEIWGQEEPHRFVVGADVDVYRNGTARGTILPRLNFYTTMQEPVATPAVRVRPHEDLYLTLLAFERDGSSATFLVVIEPLVMWIWVGGGILGLGALLALWPRRRRSAMPTTAADLRGETSPKGASP